MFDIFQKIPKSSYKDYSKSHISSGKGKSYEYNFRKYKYRKLMWELEKKLLQKFDFSDYKYLDFACGTGRILSLISSFSKTGIDISSSMIKVCKDKVNDAKLIVGDFRDEKCLKSEFDLITAFRFLPNAEHQLRNDAFRFFKENLKDNGLLIFNNHRSFWSLSYVFFRIFGLELFKEGMTHREVLNLIDKYGFKIINCYSLGVIPQTEKKSILPFFLTKIIENLNLCFFSKLHLLGYNNIYVCTTKKPI
jgi:ubiquinone/menaquinone biosynthesis C-methylase UbiE